MPAEADKTAHLRDARPPAQDWRLLLAVFWITSLVEGLGVSQIFAFVPAYLRDMGVAEPDRLHFVGLFSSLLFVVGMPLVPLWGVWADKYSRKAVIIRSSIVEAVVFAAVALSREPWQLAGSMLLIGFQLGNTGIMLGAIRDSTPRVRLGTALALFGVDGLHWGLPAVFAVSAGLSIGTALLVGLGSREVRPEVVPAGRTVELAFGALRSVLGDPAVRRIFAIFGTAFLAQQVARPYLPVVVGQVNGPVGEASAIGLVAGTAALAGALIAPIGGPLGDRIGFRPVLVAALVGGGITLGVMPFAPNVAALAIVALAFSAFYGVVSPMVFGLLATEVPPERRSQTLNLVYLPLYGAGVIGPTLGAVVVSAGISAPFLLGAAVFLAGAVGVALRLRGTPARSGEVRGDEVRPDEGHVDEIDANQRSAG